MAVESLRNFDQRTSWRFELCAGNFQYEPSDPLQIIRALGWFLLKRRLLLPLFFRRAGIRGRAAFKTMGPGSGGITLCSLAISIKESVFGVMTIH